MIDTFYVHLEFRDRENWSINLPFLCSRCGRCCTLENFLTAGPLRGALGAHSESYSKADEIYWKMGNLWTENEVKYDRYVASTQCPFLKNDNCTVYAIRPEGCRYFPCTLFGMFAIDCKSLRRFKNHCNALKRGRKTTEVYQHTETTSAKSIMDVKFSQKQYETCIARLRETGISSKELSLFKLFNK